MAGDTRWKSRMNAETQPNQQRLQSQHPQPQNPSLNLLKEAPTNNNTYNNIGYNMMEGSQQIVLL